MSFENYRNVQHVAPYVLELISKRGRLLYFGVRHTHDPDDAQLLWLEDLWEQVRPTIALNEGGNPPVAKSRREAIRRWGEAGLVRFLAAREGIPYATLEPTPAELTSQLLHEFTADELLVCYVLRDYEGLRHSNPPGPARFLKTEMRSIRAYRSIPTDLRTAEDFQAAYQEMFPTQGRWVDFPRDAFDPAALRPLSRTQMFARRASEIRDRYIVPLLCDHVERGERVFAVIGASHVVMQEPALRNRLHSVGTLTNKCEIDALDWMDSRCSGPLRRRLAHIRWGARAGDRRLRDAKDRVF